MLLDLDPEVAQLVLQYQRLGALEREGISRLVRTAFERRARPVESPSAVQPALPAIPLPR